MGAAPIAAALLLLAAAWYWRSQADADDSAGADLVAAGDEAAVDDLAGFDMPSASTDPDWRDSIAAAVASVARIVAPTSASGMRTSAAGLAHLHSFESCRLTRYRLGDGGWTIGWGRYYPDGGPLPPERIDQATADAWFAIDVRERGERWVKAYVSAPVTQSQFDALVSMAFNLSPKSFRRIADAVNAGADPEPIALQYVRAGSNLERGLRRRRSAEMAMYRSDSTLA